jgi:hypothetical protein
LPNIGPTAAVAPGLKSILSGTLSSCLMGTIIGVTI